MTVDDNNDNLPKTSCEVYLGAVSPKNLVLSQMAITVKGTIHREDLSFSRRLLQMTVMLLMPHSRDVIRAMHTVCNPYYCGS